MSEKVAVIGAGPAGLTSAYLLSKAGYHVSVYEASADIGGLSKTIPLWNQKVDLGPHRFFSHNKSINEVWLELAGDDYQMVNRLTRIYYNGSFYDYPLKAFNAFKTMGVIRATHCFASYLISSYKKLPKEGATFEQWVVSRFGRKLYEMFFKSYTEKLWGISCRKLDSDFAAQRIKKFSLGEAAKSALGGAGKKHNTLVDRFAYPSEGSGVIYERMASFIEQNGGEIILNTPVRKVLLTDDKVNGIILENGDKVDADYVVSTMPLTHMVSSLFDQPGPSLKEALDSLKYRNTVLVYLHIDREDMFDDQWLYIHSDDIGCGRICNFRNWTKQLYGDEHGSILSLEYWCYNEDEMWNLPNEELCKLAISDYTKTGLLGDGQVLDAKVVRIPNSYPVYDVGYKGHVETIIQAIEPIKNLIPIGRYGSFKYNNQDHSILMGILASENIQAGHRKHNLWAVNTDYEDYQESATIDESGLSCSSGS